MALIDPVCTLFVLQTGPDPATIDPDSGHNRPQIESFVENQRDKR
jgi:hypothetical protein